MIKIKVVGEKCWKKSSGKSRRRCRENKRKTRKRKGMSNCRKWSVDGTCSMDNTLDMAAYGGTLGFDPNNLKTSNFRKY